MDGMPVMPSNSLSKEIADEHQTIPEQKQYTKGVIAYEGLTKNRTLKKYET
jgi:hypothetical protein